MSKKINHTISNLTKLQKDILLSIEEGDDNCFLAHERTKTSLLDKGIATYTSGFGF